MKEGDIVLYENKEYVVLFVYQSGFCEIVRRDNMLDYRNREVKLVDSKSLVMKNDVKKLK
ncbi:MAG TPA: hypothetical protein VEY68_01075 [Anoxybacillus sp.]|jgi:hypothetical protein|nr:hypothetical protein [Anoxybacillus sp.]